MAAAKTPEQRAQQAIEQFLEHHSEGSLLKVFPETILAIVYRECDRVSALEKRLEAIEASFATGGAKSLIDAYQGVYRDGERYARGDLTTHAGARWFCNVDTTTRPGTGPHWTLAVKAGRDAR